MFLPAPYIPTFGTGDPTVKTSRTVPYFDTSTNPYTAWVYTGGQWNRYGVTGTINATQIQGVNVSATAPTNGQALTYDAANTQWKPA